jgi:hypothetical protein
MKRILAFILSCCLILSSTIANAATIQGWSLSNPLARGASALYDATKNAGDLVRNSTALITPNASQIAKQLGKGVAGVALSVAVEQLLGAVDWVLDPENNQI